MSDTSTIDEKKNQNNLSVGSGTFASSIVSFLTVLIILITAVLLYFSSSGLILFVCKLAQSNILPTEESCYPYTDNQPTIQPIKTNIFTTFTEPEMSMKLEFPYDNYNSHNKIIDMFREYKNKPNSNFLANYFISIIEQLINFNYAAINTIMNSLNNIPEVLIIGLGPIIIGFLSILMIVINVFYAIYLWFANMKWFFKTNANDSGNGMPKWEDVTLTSPVNWMFGIGFVILFIICFFLGLGFISILSFLVVFYCGLTCIMYKGTMNGKKASGFTIIKEVLKYYKVTIVSIISLFVIIVAFSNLGAIPGILSIITLCLIYWGVLSINIFKPITETNLTPLVSYEQAKKKCNVIKSKDTKHGFLYNLLIGQKGGDNITKELKNLEKKLNN